MKMWLVDCSGEGLLCICVEWSNLLSPVNYGEGLIALFEDDGGTRLAQMNHG
jgi:hypothetical protein